MAHQSTNGVVSRRTVLGSIAATSVLGLAGCTSGSGGTASGQSGDQQSALTGGGSSTVYPIMSDAAAVWNSNPPASDTEYWGPSQYGISTEKPFAEYWAGRYGFEPREDEPPFRVNVGLSHSGVGLEKVRKGQVDMGHASAPVDAELPDASEEELKKFTNHVVGVDAQPVVVSRAVYDAGVTKLTLDELRKIYEGEITNWTELGGPDASIQVVGRAEGSGTDTSFRTNVFGDANAPIPGVDVRKGQNQQVKTLVSNSDNAIAYLALAFVEADGAVPPIALEIDGTSYEYGKNLAEKAYPLSRDLHAYTYDGTSNKEAAFLDMVISDYGQENFVETNNYVTLTDERQKEERDRLPDPTA